MIDDILNNPSFKAKLHEQLKKGVAPEKAIADIAKDVAEKKKERDDLERKTIEKRTEQTKAKKSLKTNKETYKNEYQTVAAGNEQDKIENIATKLRTEQHGYDAAEANLETAQARAHTTEEQLKI